LSDDIQVWRCGLDNGIASQHSLDQAERARAARFAFDHLSRRYIGSHAFMRTVLAQVLGTRSESLVFDASENGKPFLRDYELAFNLSHSNAIAYLAIGGVDPIGIDVETHHHIDDLMSVARTVFSQRELAVLESAAAGDRTKLFLRCWTRKEAYVKALGVGLGARLCDITVGPILDDIVVPAMPGVSSRSFHVRSISSAATEYVAIATVTEPRTVTLREYELT
jgi:4'-phosphopantetheinyl transferase